MLIEIKHILQVQIDKIVEEKRFSEKQSEMKVEEISKKVEYYSLM